MGIDVGCALVVGLPFYEVVESSGEYYEKYEDVLDIASPTFDCDHDRCLLGVFIASEYYEYQEITGDVQSLIDEALDRFRQVTGKQGKLYVTANVT